jgi:hypothetical protein
MLLSAETSSATALSVTSSHQHASTMKIASHNKSLNAVAHTHVSATRISAAILEKPNVQKDSKPSLLSHIIVAQFNDASIADTLQLPLQPPPQLLQSLTPSQQSLQ